jgi:hypothetical protein
MADAFFLIFVADPRTVRLCTTRLQGLTTPLLEGRVTGWNVWFAATAHGSNNSNSDRHSSPRWETKPSNESQLFSPSEDCE